FAVATILGAVRTVDRAAAATDRSVEHVGRRRLRAARRRRAVLAAGARRHLVLAFVGRLQERERVIPHRIPLLLLLGGDRRNLSVRRIDDHRRPAAGSQVRGEDRGVVGAAHILLGSALATSFRRLAADNVGDLLVDRRPLLVGERR